jgi:hypothetical protein
MERGEAVPPCQRTEIEVVKVWELSYWWKRCCNCHRWGIWANCSSELRSSLGESAKVEPDKKGRRAGTKPSPPLLPVFPTCLSRKRFCSGVEAGRAAASSTVLDIPSCRPKDKSTTSKFAQRRRRPPDWHSWVFVPPFSHSIVFSVTSCNFHISFNTMIEPRHPRNHQSN